MRSRNAGVAASACDLFRLRCFCFWRERFALPSVSFLVPAQDLIVELRLWACPLPHLALLSVSFALMIQGLTATLVDSQPLNFSFVPFHWAHFALSVGLHAQSHAYGPIRHPLSFQR